MQSVGFLSQKQLLEFFATALILSQNRSFPFVSFIFIIFFKVGSMLEPSVGLELKTLTLRRELKLTEPPTHPCLYT